MYYVASMVLTGNSMGIAVKFGINTTSVVLEMGINFTAIPMLLLVQTSHHADSLAINKSPCKEFKCVSSHPEDSSATNISPSKEFSFKQVTL